jgi:hemerythrin
MAFIIRERELVTGHVDLDVQHRTLIDTLNRIGAVVGRGSCLRDELEGLLIFLRDFALAHFEYEHELMARSGYPGEAEHRRQHTALARDLEVVLDGFHRGTMDLTPDTLEYLDAWVLRHIREEDIRLADFLGRAQAP